MSIATLDPIQTVSVSTSHSRPSQAVGDATSYVHFEAMNPRGRRKSAQRRIVPEDRLLNDKTREALGSNTLDVWRNMVILQWAIRRTEDYSTLFDVQFRTGDDGLNRDLKELITRDCAAEKIDVFGRMDWDDMRRTAEAQKLLVNDCFFIQMRDKTLQMIEGSYCKNPNKRRRDGRRYVNGARLNSRKRVSAWNFREATISGSGEQDREIRASRIWQHCQFDGRPNVYRPQSPLVAGINEFRDLSETFDDMRAKVKLAQLFGIHSTRRADAEEIGEDLDPDAEEKVKSGEPRKINLGDGPAWIDGEEGETLNIIESDTPATSTQDFLQICLMIALKALDLPFNFFDEKHTNFFGSRAAWLLFERSCTARRKTQIKLHGRMTNWRLMQYVLPADLGGTGEIVLPRSIDVSDLKYRWVPRGIPWWKPKEELDTDLRAYAAGLKSMQDICDEHGFGDYRENLKEILAERQAIEDGGLSVLISKNALVRLVGTGETA